MIYLDNSSTTKQDPRVTEIMVGCMEEDFGNPSSLHRLGLDAEKIIKRSRRQVEEALALGGGRIAFASGGTEADNTAIFGAAKAMKRRGRRIVTTAVEHPAVMECMGQLEREGFEVLRIGVDRNCRLDMDSFEDALNEDTILVSAMHVNNEIGSIMPIDDISEMIRRKSPQALLHCDAVQSFCKLPLPRKADMISLSGHKIHGPKGSGALFLGKKANITQFFFGGGQEKGLRSGTENVPAIAGFGLAAEIMSRKQEEAWEQVTKLRELLLDGLRTEIEEVVLNSPEEVGTEPAQSIPYILSLSFPGTRGEVILHTLEQDGIYVSTGSACSSNKRAKSHVLTAMGCSEKEIEGTLRFSFCADNKIEEIEMVVEKTAEAVKNFRRLGSFR